MSRREKQPVYVVSAEVINQAVEAAAARYKRIGEWAWCDTDEVRATLLAQKEKIPGHYDLARLCHVIGSLHTSKLIGGANDALEFVKQQMVAGRKPL